MNSLSKRSQIFCIVLAGFLLSIAYHGVRAYLGDGYPWNTFLFDPRDRFNDFFNNVIAFRDYGFNMQIFPTQTILFWLFSILPPWPQLIVFEVIFALYFAYFMFSEFGKSESTGKRVLHTAVIGFLSLPVLFALDRANIELWMFIGISSFAVLYFKGKRSLASIPLALVIAAKLFPAVFLIFYVRDRAWKPLGVVVISLAALALALLIPFDPELTFERGAKFFGMYNTDYAIGDLGYAFGHSLWGLMKSAVYFVSGREWFYQNGSTFLKIYSPFTLVAYGSYALVLLMSPAIAPWKQLALLTALFCLLPHVSADYRLIHLFTPLAFFVNESQKGRFDGFFAIIFALLLIPKAYFQDNIGASISVIINPLLLIALIGLITAEEFREGRIWKGKA